MSSTTIADFYKISVVENYRDRSKVHSLFLPLPIWFCSSCGRPQVVQKHHCRLNSFQNFWFENRTWICNILRNRELILGGIISEFSLWEKRKKNNTHSQPHRFRYQHYQLPITMRYGVSYLSPSRYELIDTFSKFVPMLLYNVFVTPLIIFFIY